MKYMNRVLIIAGAVLALGFVTHGRIGAAENKPEPTPPAESAGGAAEAEKKADAEKKVEAIYKRAVSDGEHTLTLTTKKGEADHLLAKDLAGKVIFDGPVATEEDLAKLPAEIAAKLERLQQTLPLVEEEESDAAPEATLHIGDAAPALVTSQWLKGDAVKKIEPGKIYVIEFWATWCGPCIEAIPHLTALQKQHTDVTFIGLACSEDEPATAVEFVKKMGNKMDYHVALGDADGVTGKAWLEASGQSGIPCTFVVDKESKLAWIGHPAEVERVLKAMVAGTFDAKKEAAAAAEAAAEVAAAQEIEAQLESLIGAADVAALDALLEKHPKMVAIKQAKFNILMQTKRYAAAIALAEELCDSQKDDPNLLYHIALELAIPENPGVKPGLDLALKAALRANELVESNPAILATVARVYFIRGDLDKALEFQTKAVEVEDEENENKKLLAQYKAKQTGAKTAAPAADKKDAATKDPTPEDTDNDDATREDPTTESPAEGK